MAVVISYPRIWCHFPPFLMLEIGVSSVVPLHRRYATRQHMDATGHPWGWPVWPCPIDLPLNPFFFVVKRRLTESALARMSLVAVTAM